MRRLFLLDRAAFEQLILSLSGALYLSFRPNTGYGTGYFYFLRMYGSLTVVRSFPGWDFSLRIRLDGLQFNGISMLFHLT